MGRSRRQRESEEEAGRLLSGARALYAHGARHEAVSELERALPILRDLGDRAGEGTALNYLGALYRDLGRHQDAIQAFEQALLIVRASGDSAAEGTTLNNLGALYRESGRHQDAIRLLEQALLIRRAVGDLAGEATTLSNLGALCRELGRPNEAIDRLEQALSISREIGDRLAEGRTLNNLGALYGEVGRPGQAVECLEKALSILHELGARPHERDTLNNLGALYQRLGRPREALERLEAVLAIKRDLGDRWGQASTLNNIGLVHHLMGHLQDAVEYLEAALAVYRELGSLQVDGVDSVADPGERLAARFNQFTRARRHEGEVMENLALVYADLGRFQEALDHLDAALTRKRELVDRAGEGNTLNNLGVIHVSLGRPLEALAYFEDALAISHELGDRASESLSLNNVGMHYLRVGNSHEALERFETVLAIKREVRDRIGEGVTLRNLGLAYIGMGRLEEALARFKAALAIAQEMGARESGALNNLAMLYRRLRRPQDALELLEQALAKDREVGDRSNEWAALANLGFVYEDVGRREEALAQFEQAIALVEGLRGEILSEELRTSYFVTPSALYAAYVLLLVKSGKRERALHAAEKGRGRVFLELLAEAQGEVREGVDPELRGEEQRLLSELSTLRERVVGARSQPQEERDPDLISRLQREEQDVERALHTVEARIRAENPRYAALTQPTAWELPDIQEKLLDEDTALLEYVLSDEGSLLFCVLKDGLEVFPLPPKGEIETRVRELRAAVLHGLHRYPHGEELYRDLVAPAAGLIEGKDLLVCADGVLHYLPFSLLLTGPPEEGDGDGEPPGGRLRGTPGDEEEALLEKVRADLAPLPAFDFGSLPYLLRRHAISYAPSATVAGMVREEARGERSYHADLAALADPRGLGGEEGVEGEALPLGLQAALTHTRDALEPIPATADEVWALAGLLAGGGLPTEHPERLDRGRLVLRTAGAATKEEVERLTSGERSFRFLHIATHGLLDPEKPQFSGLVFTPRGGKDPFWRTFEIFNARIPSELVVLSACETGLGRMVSGEGIVGLTRAFLYAGAPSVCVSLWKVAEESSPRLMEAFYRRVLAGEPKAVALQGAQLELVEQTPYAHPFWWAPFVLVGER